jgi:subtilisin family serine protease
MKKFLLYLASLVAVTVTYNLCLPNPKEPKPIPNTVSPHVPQQIIVNFENETDVNRFIFKLKQNPKFADIKLVSTCPCSKKLILLEVPMGVDLNPDGDIVPPAKDQGGNGSGVSLNYTFVGFEKPSSPPTPLVVDYYRQPNPSAANVKVSIVDSGVDTLNSILYPHLLNNLPDIFYCNGNKGGIYGLNMGGITLVGIPAVSIEPLDYNGHGTFINGIIAGKADVLNKPRNEVELFTGDNEKVAINQLNVSFTPPQKNEGTLFNALCGIHYSLNQKAKVINASWGLVTWNNRIGEMMVFNPTLKELSNPMNDALLVVSAGNDEIDLETDVDKRMAWPAAFSMKQMIRDTLLDFSNNVLTVGSWNMYTNYISIFSNRGKSVVNVYAPGDSILSIDLEDRSANPHYRIDIKNNKGTSFAAPFVTRTAAIMMGLKKGVSAKDVKYTIISAAESYSPQRPNPTSTAIPLHRHREAIRRIRASIQ